MAVLVECPNCHRRLSLTSKLCQTKQGKGCGLNLDEMKKQKKVVYWIAYRLPKQSQVIWERIINDKGESKKEDAIDAMSKRRTQKRERTISTILDIRKPQDEMTFQQLTEWYLKGGFSKVHHGKVCKRPDSFETNIKKFNVKFGNRIVSQITGADLISYQNERVTAGKKPGTVDHEIGAAKAVVNKAFLAKKVDQDVVLTFRQVPRLLVKGSNVRAVIVPFDHYSRIYEVIADRSKPVWEILTYAGMRLGEVLGLTLDRISLDAHEINLREGDTKEKKEKSVPMGEEVYLLIKTRVEELLSQGASGETRLFDVSKDGFMYDVKRAHRITGLPYGRFRSDGVTAHSLRHTFKTAAVRANVSKAYRKAIQGHSTDDMDERYTHLDQKDLASAMKRINDFLNGKVEVDDCNPALFKAILEELKEIRKNVNKPLTNQVLNEKGASDYVS